MIGRTLHVYVTFSMDCKAVCLMLGNGFDAMSCIRVWVAFLGMCSVQPCLDTALSQSSSLV
jgi:hypothetical protein